MSVDGAKTDLGVRFEPTTPAGDEVEARRRHEANRVAWNEGAESYAADVDDVIEFIRDGRSNLHPLERANLEPLGRWCRRAVHLQCASGRDTLSLLNEGVEEVVGIDISDVHIANARATTDALGARARWYRCDVIDPPRELDGWADLVYTGRGAMCWLHDLGAWARAVHRLLAPGGVFHVLDDHPVSWLFEMEASSLTPSGLDYFEHCESSQGWPDTYIGDMGRALDEHAVKYEQVWPPSSIFAALTAAGLVVERFGEHREGYWENFPNLPDAERATIALSFTMMARRPG